MPDRSIPYHNIIMRLAAIPPQPRFPLPAGYAFRGWQAGDEARWAALETEIGDFGTQREAMVYFQERYLPQPGELQRRFIGVENAAGGLAGAVIAWYETVGGIKTSVLHWLAVSPARQGTGLGKALVREALRRYRALEGPPVYLHTQPWSYVAVGLYSACGFRILKSETFCGYENQYEAAMAVLQKHMRPEAFGRLVAEAE